MLHHLKVLLPLLLLAAPASFPAWAQAGKVTVVTSFSKDVTDPIKKAIQTHARVAELFAIALDEGMRTLKQDGMEKVLGGITDMHQVRAVCIK